MATCRAANDFSSKTTPSWSKRWRKDLLAVAALIVAASVVAVHAYRTTPRHWEDPDSLYYRAWVLRVEGSTEHQAIRAAFTGPISRKQREAEHGLAASERRVTNPAWVNYSSRFYERRWVTALLGSALDPIFGAAGLIVTSLIGYVLLGPFLYALLRQGYSSGPATIAALVILSLNTVREWAVWPMTDAFGLAIEALALVTGLLALRRGRGWIVAWLAAVLVLSFTRDATLVVLTGAVVSFATRRDRRALLVLGTGIAAALPAPLLFGARLRETIAYTVNNFFPARDPSWTFIVARLPGAIHALVRDDVAYLENHVVDAFVLVGGFIALVWFRRTLGSAWPFVCGAALGAIATLLVVPNYSLFRLELVLVPFCALGLTAALSVATAGFAGRAGSQRAKARPAPDLPEVARSSGLYET